MVNVKINTRETLYWFLVGRRKSPVTECRLIYNHTTHTWSISYDNEEPVPINIDRKGKEFTAWRYIKKKKKFRRFSLEYGGYMVDFTMDFNNNRLYGKAFNDYTCPDYEDKDIIEYYTQDIKQIDNKYLKPIQTYYTKSDDLFQSIVRASNMFARYYIYENRKQAQEENEEHYAVHHAVY